MSATAGEGARLGTLLTVAEVARLLRVSNMTVYRLIKSGELRAIRVGKSFRIQQQDLTVFLTDGVVHADNVNG
jgi:excisionase family DNA binding protein